MPSPSSPSSLSSSSPLSFVPLSVSSLSPMSSSSSSLLMSMSVPSLLPSSLQWSQPLTKSISLLLLFPVFVAVVNVVAVAVVDSKKRRQKCRRADSELSRTRCTFGRKKCRSHDFPNSKIPEIFGRILAKSKISSRLNVTKIKWIKAFQLSVWLPSRLAI